ncbi:MAG: ATP-binding cassette domain-containing protein [Nanoarchaeota archaeon]
MVNDIIKTYDLRKVYKLKDKPPIVALDNINMSIKEGEIFGLLGPNGAGKTTLVSILTTLLQPSSGYADVFGYNILKYPKKIKEKIGLMLGDEIIYNRLTGYDNLKFFCRIYGIKNYDQKIQDITEELGINKWLNQYVENYSRGMKLKLALSRVLLIDPEILFLDEPMLGLDPKSVKKVIKIIRNLGKTVLLTSHQMHIVHQLCDRIAFLNKGKIIKIDTKENFKKLIQESVHIQIKLEKPNGLLEKELNNLDYVTNVKREGNVVSIYLKNKTLLPALLKLLSNYTITKINEIEPSLDDVFIELSKV